MKTNIGSIDRVLHAALGVALLGMTVAGIVGPWGWLGAVPLLTAGIGFCPLYAALGVNTCPARR